MKKILVVACLLSISVCENISDNAKAYIDFLTEKELLSGKYKYLTSCDDEYSQACKEMIKENCGDSPEKICIDGTKRDYKSNKWEKHTNQINSNFIYEQMNYNYNKAEFQKIINMAYEKQIKIETILLNNEVLDKIIEKNLIEQATDIISIYGTIKDVETKKIIKEYDKNNEATKILLGE